MRVAPDPAVGRLTRRPEFLAAASAGRRFHTDRLTFQGRRRDDGAGLRVGLTVTKKVGHATERNRIRRRLRAAVAEVSPVDTREPLDLVLVGRRPALTAPFDTLVDDLRRGLGAVLRPRPDRPVAGPRPTPTPPSHA